MKKFKTVLLLSWLSLLTSSFCLNWFIEDDLNAIKSMFICFIVHMVFVFCFVGIAIKENK